ncbi:MAG: class I SAM-dependent methyltransferase [Burkholderiales bacterium]
MLWPELIAEWELSPQWVRWMNDREGSRCAWCGSSLRSSRLARAIVNAVNRRAGTAASHLSALFRDRRARSLNIAEINAAGNLHRYLARCRGLQHSEFGSQAPGVRSEDLMQLSYADASFDLVITSDTLEHVPDAQRALRETHRVLKPGGAHVFSTPVVADRPSRRRALLVDGVVTHLLAPSHHGAPNERKDDFLVFHEFGSDFETLCRHAGFELHVDRDDCNPALVTFTAYRPLV